MAVKRQDAWTADDDMILAEVALRHIRDGGTQLSAFEEVAEKLGRTPAACGFRWNSAVRKKYESAIKIAKSQRQKRIQEKGRVASFRSQSLSEEFGTSNDPVHSLDNIIRFLRQYKTEVSELHAQQKKLEEELEQQEGHIKRLERENDEMKHQLSHVQSDYRLVNDDYRTLVQIMDRARKMSVLKEEPEAAPKARFRLESGTLQRIDK